MSTSLDHRQLVTKIADLLKEFDSTRPKFANWSPGIGPFEERPLVEKIARRLTESGIAAETEAEVDTVKRIDMVIEGQWAIEFKLGRPFRDNGDVEPHWIPKLIYPYEANYESNKNDSRSSISDAIKLQKISTVTRKCVFAIGYERGDPPEISLEPAFRSFEVIAESVMSLTLSTRVEENAARIGSSSASKLFGARVGKLPHRCHNHSPTEDES